MVCYYSHPIEFIPQTQENPMIYSTIRQMKQCSRAQWKTTVLSAIAAGDTIPSQINWDIATRMRC